MRLLPCSLISWASWTEWTDQGPSPFPLTGPWSAFKQCPQHLSLAAQCIDLQSLGNICPGNFSGFCSSIPECASNPPGFRFLAWPDPWFWVVPGLGIWFLTLGPWPLPTPMALNLDLPSVALTHGPPLQSLVQLPALPTRLDDPVDCDTIYSLVSVLNFKQDCQSYKYCWFLWKSYWDNWFV